MEGYHYIKRGIDIILSGMAIVILSPLLLFLCIAIKLDTQGPILFKQKRVGIHRSFFQIYKFRTMRIDTPKDVPTHMLENPEQYITKVGKFLRKTSLDELPQIFNILKGDMSVVGPRPERPEIAAQYCEEMPEFALRLQAKAGLTGYAQVYGKYNTTPYDKLQMDLMYIAHPSLIEDLKIMLATVKILFMPESTEGVAEGATTAMGQETEE